MSRTQMRGRASCAFLSAAMYAFCGGALSFLGWPLDIPWLTDWFQRGASIQPNTAVLITLSGTALILIFNQYRRPACVLGLFVAIVSGLTLLQYFIGVDFGFNHQLTFGRPWGQHLFIAVGRPGPPASFSLMLVGIAIVLFSARSPLDSRLHRYIPLLGVVVAVIMLFSLSGYVFDARNFYSIPWLSAIAFQTATMLMMLGVGLIVAMPKQEPMLTLCSDSRAAVLARIVLPTLIGLPILIGVLGRVGEVGGLVDAGTGRAIGTIFGIVVTVGLMWWTLMVLRHREQRERDTSLRLASVLGSITDGLVTIDKDWRYTLVNDEMVKRVGKTREEILGKLVSEILPDAIDNERDMQLNRAMTERVSVEYEVYSQALQRWFRDKAYPTQDGGLAIYSQDITDRKQTERLIATRAQQFQSLIDNAPLGVFLIDADFRLAQVNPIAVPVFGEIAGGIVGRDFNEIIRILWEKETADEIVHHFRQTLQTGEPYIASESGQTRLDRGVTEYYDWRINRVPLPDGRFGVVCYFHDISQQVKSREAIAKSERWLRLVTDAMPALISYVDSEGRYQFNNKLYQEWFGYQADELHGKPICEVVGDHAFEKIRPYMEAALAGERLDFEGEVPYRDAGTRFIRAEYVPDIQPDGKVAGYYALILDITHRKLAEESLLKRNRELSLLAATSQELVFGRKSEPEMLQAVFDKTLQALDMEIFFNFIIQDDPETLHMTASSGLTDEQRKRFAKLQVGEYLCGTVAHLREPVVIETLQQSDDPNAQVLRDVGVRCYVGVPLIARGELFGTIAFATRTRDQLDEGELQLMQTVCDQVAATLERGRLIAELRQSEERSRSLVSVLRASEERMQLAMTIADAGTWDHDLITGTLHWSESHFRLLGYEPTPNQEATLAMWQDAIAPDDMPRLIAEEKRAKRDRDLFHSEHQVRRTDGEQIWVRAAGRFFYDSDGKAVRFIGVFFDVTAAKQAEQALRDADRRKDEFLATLAHELRNPLAPIRNGLHILQMAGSDASDYGDLINMMERQVSHMVRLVDDLLEVSRITRGKIDLRKEKVELSTIIRSAVETAAPAIEAAGHHLDVSVPTEKVMIEADPVRLAQVLANLLNNAAKYTEDGGQIWLTAKQEADHVNLSVRDNGHGIPDEMLPKVFELFTQIDRTLGRSQGGLGIGLALVKNLVDLHGGKVEVRSDGPGCGSEFIVRLPLSSAHVSIPDGVSDMQSGNIVNALSDTDTLNDAKVVSNPVPKEAKKHRIIVVDDNRDAANTLGMLLRVLGADVRTVYDGASALEAIAQECPDVVFLDIGMPGMDGYEVAAEIRRQPQFADLLLVALTGWGQDEDRRRSSEAGFDHHLTKPPDFNAVKTVLDSLNQDRSKASELISALTVDSVD